MNRTASTWFRALATLALAVALPLAGCGKPKPAGQACHAIHHEGRGPSFDVKPPRTIADMQVYHLCNRTFAIDFSGVTRGPIASSEHLTRDDLELARGRRRHDAFHPDQRLPPAVRTSLEDWRARGLCLDRGHMANNGDAPTDKDADETFVLSNMVPQDTDSNERAFEALESLVRAMATRAGEAYVVTGPVFKGPGILLNRRIYVPQFVFKAFLIPSTGEAGAYVVRNAAGMDVAAISLEKLREWAAVDAFPAATEQQRRMVPPTPRLRPRFNANRELQGRCTPVQVGGGPLPTQANEGETTR